MPIQLLKPRWYCVSGLLLAACNWQQETCNAPRSPELEYSLQLRDARTGQDLFRPGSGFSPDSVRFFLLSNGFQFSQPLPVTRAADSTVRIGPVSVELAHTGTSISIAPTPGQSITYLDLLVRLNRQDTDTLTVAARREFRGGDECGQHLVPQLRFYYNGRLSSTYSLTAPDTLQAFTVPATAIVPLTKLR